MDSRTDDSTTLSARLRAARELAGLSQGQVARMLGLHRPSVSEIEAGRRRVTAAEITRLARIYGVSVDWLTNSEDISAHRARIELAARNLAQLKPEDLERVLDLLTALRVEESDSHE